MAHYDYSTQATLKAEIEKTRHTQEDATADGDTAQAATLQKRIDRLSANLRTAEKKTETVTRVVRPRQHIGAAYGGDTITIDAADLQHSPIASVLWTEEEAQAAARELERRRAAMFSDTPSPAQLAADKALASSRARRNEEMERQRTTLPIDARPGEIPR